jgi:hypothetical protein
LEEDPLMRKLRRITQDPELRRDLLWLRAQEKEDEESRASLERADPRLRERMDILLADTRPDRMEDRRARRHEFARLWQQRFDSA